METNSCGSGWVESGVRSIEMRFAVDSEARDDNMKLERTTGIFVHEMNQCLAFLPNTFVHKAWSSS